jgi:hypothetical protein
LKTTKLKENAAWFAFAFTLGSILNLILLYFEFTSHA